MKKLLVWFLASWLTLVPQLALAAVGTIFVDSGGCNTSSATQCSGTTNSAIASAFGSGSTITCSATSGVGASVPGCTITGSGAAAGQLSGIAVDGSQAVWINCATNTNQKSFWITAVDNTAGAISTIGLVGTPITPTGCTAATSDWGIGGRFAIPSGSTAISAFGGLRPGDTVQVNNDQASRTATVISLQSGSGGDLVNGPLVVTGVLGAGSGTCKNAAGTGTTTCPKLIIGSGSQNVMVVNSQMTFVSNLELDVAGSGVAVSGANNTDLNNVRVVGTNTGGCLSFTLTAKVVNSELKGCGGDGITTSSFVVAQGNYIHGVGGNGITMSAAAPEGSIVNNVIASNTGKGISFTGASGGAQNHLVYVANNTVYHNGGDGLAIAVAGTPLALVNNVFQDNGFTSGFNVNLASGGGFPILHYNNTYYIGAGSGVNFNNFTANSTESTSNPVFANAASANFAIGANGSAFNTGAPQIFNGASTSSSASMGAAVPASGGGAPPMIGGT